MKSVDLESPVPKYYQIKDILKEMILSGKLKDGEKLDTCRDMAKHFDTTYLTINHAIGLLDKEKLIRRIQGKGIFVNKRNTPLPQDRKVHAIMTYRGEVYGDIFSSFLAGMDKTGFRTETTDLLPFSKLPYSEQEERLESIISDGTTNFLIDGASSFPLKLLVKHIDRINQLTFIHRYEKDFRIEGANYVLVDYFSAGYSVAKHFIEKGHRQILFITFGTDDQEWLQKTYPHQYQYDIERGILAAMKEHHLDKNEFLRIFETSPDKSEKLLQYLKGSSSPAILCNGDYLALDAYNILSQNKLNIGKDVSVAGFFNTQLAEKLYPALTSLSINADEMGRLAAETVRNNCRGANIPVKTELIIRESA